MMSPTGARSVDSSDGSESTDRQPELMQGVQRAVAILEFLAAQPGPTGPSAISRGVGLSKPTVVRALRTWQSLGYVKRHAGSYELGWRIFTLVGARGQAQEVHAAAKRYLAILNAESGETVHLAVLSDFKLTYVDKLDGRRSIRVFGEIGRAAPLHATATGKALLAYGSPEFVEQLIARSLESYTSLTKSDPAELNRDLQETRERGYSINHGEWHVDVGGVGAPIFNYAGETEAAFGISFPIAASDDSRIRELGELVRGVAQQLSQERGWIPTR
jgi:DNA-binding IclR family transcriptional regulator